MAPPRLEDRAIGQGWGCLRFATAGLVLLFTFIGLIPFLGPQTGLLPILFALTLAVLWFMVARNFRWRGALVFGPLLALLLMILFEILAPALHRQN